MGSVSGLGVLSWPTLQVVTHELCANVVDSRGTILRICPAPLISQPPLTDGSGFSVSLRAGRVRVAGQTRFHRALPILSCQPGRRRAGLSFVRAGAESKYFAKPSQAAVNNDIRPA